MWHGAENLPLPRYEVVPVQLSNKILTMGSCAGDFSYLEGCGYLDSSNPDFSGMCPSPARHWAAEKETFPNENIMSVLRSSLEEPVRRPHPGTSNDMLV